MYWKNNVSDLSSLMPIWHSFGQLWHLCYPAAVKLFPFRCDTDDANYDSSDYLCHLRGPSNPAHPDTPDTPGDIRYTRWHGISSKLSPHLLSVHIQSRHLHQSQYFSLSGDLRHHSPSQYVNHSGDLTQSRHLGHNMSLSRHLSQFSIKTSLWKKFLSIKTHLFE